MNNSLVDFEPPEQVVTPAPVYAEHQEGSGGDDHASVIPSTPPDPPTTSELLAQTTDAADVAEADKSELPKATPPNMPPQAADAADAGIKNKHVEYVSSRSLGGRNVPVWQHRTHVKTIKPSASMQLQLKRGPRASGSTTMPSKHRD
jgi:hypothetical protein